MRKTGLLLFAFFLVPYISYGQSATTRNVGQDFPLLTSRTQFSTVTAGEVRVVNFVVSTEARFAGYLISDDGWSGLGEEDKWQVALYEYNYKFENNSDEKVSALFTNRDVLLSPLTKMFGNYSLILEPREIKTIKFIANTKLQEAYGGSMFLSLWDEQAQRWYIAGTSVASLYVPRFNALFYRD